jgi:hypothetical protein
MSSNLHEIMAKLADSNVYTRKSTYYYTMKFLPGKAARHHAEPTTRVSGIKERQAYDCESDVKYTWDRTDSRAQGQKGSRA